MDFGVGRKGRHPQQTFIAQDRRMVSSVAGSAVVLIWTSPVLKFGIWIFPIPPFDQEMVFPSFVRPF